MPLESQPSDLAPRDASAARVVLLVTVGAAVLSSLDLFVVNVAFDRIGRDLGVGLPDGPTPGDLSWVLNGYAVVVAALMVPFGRLADRYGRRRLFLLGVAVFTLASAACALSPDPPTVIAVGISGGVSGCAVGRGGCGQG